MEQINRLSNVIWDYMKDKKNCGVSISVVDKLIRVHVKKGRHVKQFIGFTASSMVHDLATYLQAL
jgi:hypothetical protein